jgi:hypothetical protein
MLSQHVVMENLFAPCTRFGDLYRAIEFFDDADDDDYTDHDLAINAYRYTNPR